MKVAKMLKPMLCDTKIEPFNDPVWVWERKMDGIRAIITLQGGVIKSIQARSGEEKLNLFPDVQFTTKCDCILDGEIVARTGKFNDIQHRTNRGSGIAQAAKDYPAEFIAFDVIQANGVDVTSEFFQKRRETLEALAIPCTSFGVSPLYDKGEELFDIACQSAWEGIVGKRIDSRYSYGSRSPNWLKVKVWRQEVYWVVGYTPGTGWRTSTFGALVLASLNGGIMKHVGEVGTGFDSAEIQQLFARLSTTPIAAGPFHYSQPAKWVTPFPVKIRFLELSNDGIVRFPSYKGMIDPANYQTEVAGWTHNWQGGNTQDKI